MEAGTDGITRKDVVGIVLDSVGKLSTEVWQNVLAVL